MPLRLIFILLLLTLGNTNDTNAANNAGIVEGLWYNDNKFFADQSVRLYVAVRNNTGAELSGTVTFFDNDVIITKKAINALDERIVESWADWTPSYGEHTVRAELSRLELSTVDGETAKTSVSSALAEDIVFVDRDTDGDSIGDKEDTDDDGDGISDEAEVAAGTDPMVFNEPEVRSVNDTSNDDQEARESSTIQSGSNTSEGAPGSTETTGGLERYLTPSRADTLLSSVTQMTEQAKKSVDEYREKRQLKTAIATNDPELAVNSDGFGEIIRSTSKQSTPEKPDGFMGDLITFIATILSGLMTGILAATSWSLSYPILIQLLLLFGILYALYRVTKHFGKRPS